MTTRQLALAEVKETIREHGITSTRYRAWKELVFLLRDKLQEEFCYFQTGTQNCIINQAARELGIAAPRDSFRSKVYRVEDHVVYPLIAETTPYYTMCTPLVELQELLESACVAIGMPRAPDLKLTPANAKMSVAHGSRSIALSEKSGHLTPAVLFHELAHCYCSAKRLGSVGHDAKFFAAQMAIVVRMGYASRDRIFQIRDLVGKTKHTMPFDEELFKKMVYFD